MQPADAAHSPATAAATPADGPSPTAPSTKSAKSTKSDKPAPPAEESLATFIAKFRELAAQARPPKAALATIESTDPGLRAALAVEIAAPTAEHMRAVATEYRRLGVFDRAHTYLMRALTVVPDDPITYDAIARLWRDAGLPHLGLTDAHRAVYFAPTSPEARNTLGTVLQALGQRQLARQEYERALALNPKAAYALNNLCYSSLLEGEHEQAIALCRKAVDVEPDLIAARNNLAMAYQASGNAAAAQREFAAAGDRATALYNSGIVHMAQHQYDSAVRAFQEAHALKPTLTQALARAKQAVAARDTEE